MVGAWRRRYPACLASAVALSLPAAAGAVPPPPSRPDIVLDVRHSAVPRVVADAVRPYQPVPVAFQADAGHELLVWLSAPAQQVSLAFETPSGLQWMQGVVPGPDGLRLRLPESGLTRVFVSLGAEAAREGRTAPFELRLQLRP